MHQPTQIDARVSARFIAFFRALARVVSLSFSLSLALLAAPAFAGAEHWELHDATLQDGAAMSGFFDLDADTGALLDWNISVPAGTVQTDGGPYLVPAASWTPENSFGSAGPGNLWLSDSADYTHFWLRYTLGTAPGDALVGDAEIYQPGFWHRVTPAETGAIATAPVPEPSSALLIGLGLLGAAGYRALRARRGQPL